MKKSKKATRRDQYREDFREKVIRARNMLMKNSELLAYEDMEFMESEACRPIRLMMEFVKPEIAMQLQRIESTMVIFGSARIPAPEAAHKRLEEAEAALKRNPSDLELLQKYRQAQIAMKNSHYYTVARDLGRIVSQESAKRDKTDKTFVVLTGAGPGIMEAGNRGAHDAEYLNAGLRIALPFEQASNAYVTPGLCFRFHYFNMRKMHFMSRAKAVACFPGGFGTMDEMFEALTLIQTGCMPRIPFLMYGKEFWEKLINWNHFVENGLISPEDLNLFSYCETAEEGWEKIMKFYEKEPEKAP